MAPVEGWVLVLDNLQHSVSTESLAGFLERQNFEQGITWETVTVIKKFHNLALREEYKVRQDGSEVSEGDNAGCGANEEVGASDENQTTPSSSRSASPGGSGDSGVTTDEGTLDEDIHKVLECSGDSISMTITADDNDEFYHRGFIVCSGSHITHYLLQGLEGLNLFGKPLEIKVADEVDLEELLEYQRSQMVPKLLISCINERSPHFAMRVHMVRELLRVIRWAESVEIERIPRTCENMAAGTQFLLTPQTSEETQKLLQLLKEVNFYEFKVTANVKPVPEEKCETSREKESKDDDKESIYCHSWFAESEEESGLGTSTSRSRSNSESDPSMSYDASVLSTSSVPFNFSSAHVIPRAPSAVLLTTQTTLHHLPLRFLLPEMYTRILIGENQQTIRWIADKSGASIAVLEKQFFIRGNNWFDKMVILFGTEESYQIALRHILEILTQEAGRLMLGYSHGSADTLGIGPGRSGPFKRLTNELVDDDGQTIYLRILAFNSITGRLIGRFGKNLKDIMALTETKITISSIPYTWNEQRADADRLVLIEGNVDNVLQSCFLVTRKLANAFSLQFKTTGLVAGETIALHGAPYPQQQYPQFHGFMPPHICVQHPGLPGRPPFPMPMSLPVSRAQSSMSNRSTHRIGPISGPIPVSGPMMPSMNPPFNFNSSCAPFMNGRKFLQHKLKHQHR